MRKFCSWRTICVKGVPMATPVFDGAVEEEIKHMLRLAGLPESGPDNLV